MASLTNSTSVSRVVPGPPPSCQVLCQAARTVVAGSLGGRERPATSRYAVCGRAEARQFGPHPPVPSSSGFRALEVTGVSCTADEAAICTASSSTSSLQL